MDFFNDRFYWIVNPWNLSNRVDMGMGRVAFDDPGGRFGSERMETGWEQGWVSFLLVGRAGTLTIQAGKFILESICNCQDLSDFL